MAAPETLTIEKEQGEASAVEERLPSRRKRNAAIFVPLAALWLVLDIATKAYFNGFSVGQVVAGPVLGLVQFRLVHNTRCRLGYVRRIDVRPRGDVGARLRCAHGVSVHGLA